MQIASFGLPAALVVLTVLIRQVAKAKSDQRCVRQDSGRRAVVSHVNSCILAIPVHQRERHY